MPSPKTYLVTGGAGFIGSHFIDQLLAQPADVVAKVVNLDALTYAGNKRNLTAAERDPRHMFIHEDITNAAAVEKVFAQHHPDVVIHFAAESHVDRSIQSPEIFIQTNVVGTLRLLEAARRAWGNADATRHRFHHVSTDEVYGDIPTEAPPANESTAYAPRSPYAASKAASDHLVRSYSATYNLPIIISNCSNNYGPRQFPEKLIPVILLQAIAGKPLPIYGDGLQIRDWLYVTDHCEGIWRALIKGTPGQTYHFAGGNQTTNRALVEMLCHILDKQLPDSSYQPHIKLLTYVPDRPGHDRRYALDATKTSDELGWNPQHSLQQGLEKTVSWYLQHQDWIQTIRQERVLA